MSILKDLAVSAIPSFTFSIKEGLESEPVCSESSLMFVTAFGAGSPANLHAENLVNERNSMQRGYLLIWHNHKKPFASIFIRLKLVIGGLNTSTTAKEDQKLRGKMWIVARPCDVDLENVNDKSKVLISMLCPTSMSAIFDSS